tara:strand:- start:111 stop:416 length:306 start_codon:yes stop_codon:yes gene_type:complete
MVFLTFYWDCWAILDNKEIFRMIQREDYRGETWRDCCDECAKLFDWDNSDLVRGFENNITETNRQLNEICINENGEEFEAPPEIYVYYKSSVEKLKKEIEN